MSDQNKAADGKAVGALDAPLTLAADQLERVAGGMTPAFGVHGPILGLVFASKA